MAQLPTLHPLSHLSTRKEEKQTAVCQTAQGRENLVEMCVFAARRSDRVGLPELAHFNVQCANTKIKSCRQLVVGRRSHSKVQVCTEHNTRTHKHTHTHSRTIVFNPNVVADRVGELD